MHKRFQEIESSLNSEFVERKEEIHGLTLAILSDNNILMLGPPGVGKSLLAYRWANHITNANFFKWLLSQTTKDDEIAGPPDLQKLANEGEIVRNTAGKLPEAHLAFLDEIWKSSSAIANFLLKALNERKFDNGEGDEDIPLLSVVAASNELPDPESNLEAARDRFVLNYDVSPVMEPANVTRMMENHLELARIGYDSLEIPTVDLDEIEEARIDVINIEVPEDIIETVRAIAEDLRDQQIEVSPRTLNKVLRILQAEAWFNGRDQVMDDDLEVLVHCLWRDTEDIDIVYNTVLKLINPDKPEIIAIFEDSRELYEKIMSDKQNSNIFQEGLEAVEKLKNARKDLNNHIKKMEKRKKDISDVTKYRKKIDDYIDSILEDACELDINDIEGMDI